MPHKHTKLFLKHFAGLSSVLLIVVLSTLVVPEKPETPVYAEGNPKPNFDTVSYTSNPNAAIPDSSNPTCNQTSSTALASTISVPENGTINDVNLRLNISHTWIGDVQVLLTSPQGTMIEVVQSIGNASARGVGTSCGCSSANMTTTLDDESSGGNVDNACPPTGANYTPFIAVNGFDGQNLNGIWTLTIYDWGQLEVGTLNSWGLDFDYTSTGPTSTPTNTYTPTNTPSPTPTNTPNFIAVQNGDWSVANTWNNNAVPGSNDSVLIPAGITVTFSDTFSDRYAPTQNDGTLEVLPGVWFDTRDETLTNNGTVLVGDDSRFAFYVTGHLANYGTITVNGGWIDITSSITNHGTMNFSETSWFLQDGAVDNYGTINIYDWLSRQPVVIYAGGTITNYGTVDRLSGGITNYGTYHNYGDLSQGGNLIVSEIHNYGTFTNYADGTIDLISGSDIYNYPAGIFDNYGLITQDYSDGMIYNQGTFTNHCGGIVPPDEWVMYNPIIHLCATVTPTYTQGGPTITPTFTSTATHTRTPGGPSDTPTSTPTPTATPAGYTAIQSGNWNVASTWLNGMIPSSGDVVTIMNGVTVTIPNGLTVDRYAITYNNGTILVNTGGVFRKTSFYADNFINNGVLVNDGWMNLRNIINYGTLTLNSVGGASFDQSVANFGIINNYDNDAFQIVYPVTNYTGSVFNNYVNNKVQRMVNRGTLNNYSTLHDTDIENYGTFTNFAGAALDNSDEGFGGYIENRGTGVIHNYGTIISRFYGNYGWIWNYCGGVITPIMYPISPNPVWNICPTDTPTPTNTFTPSNTPTPSYTFTSTYTPTDTPTSTDTFTPSDTPTDTATFTPSDTFTPSNTPTIILTVTASDTFMPSDTFTPSVTTCAMVAIPPTLDFPAHRAHTTDRTPKFSWGNIAGAQSYRLMVYLEDRSFEYKKRVFVNNYTLTNAEALTPAKYLWRVRTQDQGCSTWTAWSKRNTLFVD